MQCVIMAGGKGTRFWPRSRAALPKQLLDIVSEKTMLQETIERLLPCCPPENILIITNVQQEALVRKQAVGIPSDNIIAEPTGKNTAPCIALAAALLLLRGSDDVMVIMPADHYIRDAHEFQRCVTRAVAAASAHDVLVTIGIQPYAPETGYGYIQRGTATLPGFQDIHQVERFHEKPDRATAAAFLQQGNFFWNSGMFIWKPSVIMRELQHLLPEVYEPIARLQTSADTTAFLRGVADAYEKVPSISIDYGVMEKACCVYVIRGDFGWSDIGSWSAIYDIAERNQDGNVLRGEVITHDTHGSLITAESRLVAVVGLRDVIVVETGDAILVCPRDRAQDIRYLVDTLERTGKKQYL